MTNTIKISLLSFLITLCGLTTVSAQLTGSSFEAAIKTGKAEIVYIYNDVTDFAKQSPNGEVHGLLVDLMKEFEKFVYLTHNLNVEVSFQKIPDNNFQEFLETVRTSSGGVFGLSNTSITEERAEKFQFSLPYIENISILVTESNVPNLNTISEISEAFVTKKAFSVAASTYLSRLHQIKESYFPELEIELVNSGLDVMNKVSGDSNSFAIVDLLYYLEFYKKGYAIKRHQVGDLNGDLFGIIMPLNNDWKPILDDFFQSGFIQSPEYRKIISNHLGKSAIRLVGNM